AAAAAAASEGLGAQRAQPAQLRRQGRVHLKQSASAYAQHHRTPPYTAVPGGKRAGFSSCTSRLLPEDTRIFGSNSHKIDILPPIFSCTTTKKSGRIQAFPFSALLPRSLQPVGAQQAMLPGRLLR